MTEQQWLECTDPQRMLDLLRSKGSDRKLRLFTCARSRAVWDLLRQKYQRQAVETAESFADGKATSADLVQIHGEVWQNVGRAYQPEFEIGARIAASVVAADGLGEGTWDTAFDVSSAQDQIVLCAAAESESALIRDIFGNLFRPVSVYPGWLTPTVASLLMAAYTERELPSGRLDSDRLAILADALEEAGCDNADILNHLRGPGPHVRGCWVLDQLLDKK